jgi:hypothetical protein
MKRTLITAERSGRSLGILADLVNGFDVSLADPFLQFNVRFPNSSGCARRVSGAALRTEPADRRTGRPARSRRPSSASMAGGRPVATRMPFEIAERAGGRDRVAGHRVAQNQTRLAPEPCASLSVTISVTSTEPTIARRGSASGRGTVIPSRAQRHRRSSYSARFIPMAAWMAMRPGTIRPARIEPSVRFSTSFSPWRMAQAEGCRTDRAVVGSWSGCAGITSAVPTPNRRPASPADRLAVRSNSKLPAPSR